MPEFTLRPMQRDDWNQVAELIYDSTNAWYVANGRSPIFSGPKSNALLFCRVYETLDPGCCVVAEDNDTGQLAGSCFYHPRPTHVSLGIMNVGPNYFGHGIARQLRNFITDFADSQNLPTRLVSSAVNLDSFSLYSRGGFVPRLIYQDMILAVPDEGVTCDLPQTSRVRPATIDDIPAMVQLEKSVHGLDREKDFQYFIDNADAIWSVSVLTNQNGDGLDGFLVSVSDPCSHMLGPGVMQSEDDTIALIADQLNQYRNKTFVWLVPSHCQKVVDQMYQWGAKNCELHFAQCRGQWIEPTGIVMPTFMPETS